MGFTLNLTASDMLLVRGNFTDAVLNVAINLTDTYTTLRAYASGNLPVARYAWTATSDATVTPKMTWSTEAMTATGDSGALTATLEAPGTGNSSRSASLVIYGITGRLKTVTVTNNSATQLAKYDAALAGYADPYTDPQNKKWYLQGSGWQYMQGIIFPSETLKRNITSPDVRVGISA